MAEEAEFVTLIEDDAGPAHAPPPGWKVAVVDDDPAVHTGTRFALQDFTLNGRGLELLSARSAAEARELFGRHPDLAVILLDVVMETEGAGLELVQFVRSELKNETVRIILRTGQPGQAPERRVVVDYDINDYKAKTELTADKLFTALTAALRSYEQLLRLVETRRGLEIIIDAAASLFDQRSLQRLAEGVLVQLATLMDVECAGILVLREEGDGGALGAGRLRQLSRLCHRGGKPVAGGGVAPAAQRGLRQARPPFLACAHDSLYRHGKRARTGRADGFDARADRHRPGAGDRFLQPPCGRLRQCHALRAAGARQSQAGGEGDPPHGAAHRGEGAAGEPERAAEARQRFQERGARHRCA